MQVKVSILILRVSSLCLNHRLRRLPSTVSPCTYSYSSQACISSGGSFWRLALVVWSFDSHTRKAGMAYDVRGRRASFLGLFLCSLASFFLQRFGVSSLTLGPLSLNPKPHLSFHLCPSLTPSLHARHLCSEGSRKLSARLPLAI